MGTVLLFQLRDERPIPIQIAAAPSQSTVAELGAEVERMHLARKAEQLFIVDGRRLEPSERLAELAEGNAGVDRSALTPQRCSDLAGGLRGDDEPSTGWELAVHLVRRPDPTRLIGFSVRIAGSAVQHSVEGVRADATVCQVRAAALAALRKAGVAIPHGSLRLMLGGKVLDEGAGLIAAEYGLDNGASLFAVASGEQRPAAGSFYAQVKIPGVPAVRMGAVGSWRVRDLKDALGREIRGRWDASSALCRRCHALDLSDSEIHFRATSPGHTRLLDDDDDLPSAHRGSVYFVLPGEQSLDSGARLLLGSVVEQQDAGSAAMRAERIRSALLESASAELRLQLAVQTAQPDCKVVNGKRKQRSVKRSHSHRQDTYGCRAQAGRRVQTDRVPLRAPRIHSS